MAITERDRKTEPAPDRGSEGFLRRNWKVLVPLAVAGAAIAAWLAFGVFAVHLLWVDDEVDEAAPVFDSGASTEEATPDDAAPAEEPAAPAEAAVSEVAQGDFVSLDHGTEGRAVVLNDGTDQRFLRFEGFSTDNGPDLNVYLTTNPPDGPGGAFDDDFVDLGDLQGNVGDQNYEIPPGVDLTVHDTVVIWCVRFSSPFGEATLAPT